MCGIFCTVCASTDVVQAKRKKIFEDVKPFLLRRGPDSYSEKKFNCFDSNCDNNTLREKVDSDSSNGCTVHLAAFVLHLRGECIAKQPVEDSFGNILAWNGEIFEGLEIPTHESDTTALLKHLSSSLDNNEIEKVLKTMSRIHGPWAIVYYEAERNTLWFGRDYFGRRSLLWHLPSSPSDVFAISSVGTRLIEDTGEQFWKEVPADGIYSLDLRRFGEYFSSGDGKTIDIQDVLRRYPWQNPPECPVCPVRKEFNKEILYGNDRTTLLASTNNSKEKCQLSHEDDIVCLVSKEDQIVNDKQNKTEDNLGSCLSSSSYCGAENITCKTKESILNYTVNKDESNDRTCVTHSLTNCHVTAVKKENDAAGGDSDFNKQQQDILHRSANGDKVHSKSLQENIVGRNLLTQLSSSNDYADSMATKPSTIDLCKEGCFSYDVVEQFTNVLMEAVRRRVFNLPRKTKIKPSIPSGKIQDIHVGKHHEKEEYVESTSNVGILFSGGLDSIVLAALADRCVPLEEPIDLINVAFEQKKAKKHTKQGRKQKQREESNNHSETFDINFEVPDRVTGRNGLGELKCINPQRTWNFVEVNVTLEELQKERSNYITHLVCPQSTVLDDSIGCALWFAAKGQGNLTCNQCIENINENLVSCNHYEPYICPAKVLLVGMGADEQLGGYARHRSRFNKEGWKGLVDEIEMEVQRISKRNLGRDDRCISDHGRESRCPFLDEDVVSFLNALPVWIKCDPRLPRGIGEKILLRQVAKSLGLTASSNLPKRAIQFGSRIAKLESSSEKGGEKCSRL